MQLVLNTNGVFFSVKNGVFLVKAGEEQRQISPEQVSSIGVTAACSISSAAIELAVQADIPIYLFDESGDAVACLRSPYFESIASLRRKQVYFSDHAQGAQWVVDQFILKSRAQQAVLGWLGSQRSDTETARLRITLEMDKLQERKVTAPTMRWSNWMMGWEGNVARLYWESLSAGLPPDWRFEGRSRRPARDSFNALLNYGYGMLYALVEQAIFAAGLDPHLGILHVDEYDRPTLAFDLIEPFRPWVDRFIVEGVCSKEIACSWLEVVDEGYFLNSAGKKEFIPRLNGYLQTTIVWEGKRMTRTAHIYRRAALLARQIDETMKRP